MNLDPGPSENAGDELQRQAKRQLMKRAGEIRSRLFPFASDEAWRRERLFRYLYWREHGEHCPFNLVGAWEPLEIQMEIARWEDYERRGLSEERVLDLLGAELEERHGKTWQEALEEGTSPLLASVGAPIWNEATGSLLPSHLGPLPLCRADYDASRPHLGWQYHYDLGGSPEKVSVSIYDAGEHDLGDGARQPQVREHFIRCCQDIATFARANGCTLVDGSAVGPVTETLTDSHGRELEFGGTYIEVDDAEGTRRGEALSLRAFRNHFLKVRYTHFNVSDGGSGADWSVEAINADIAEFVGHFT